MEEEVKAEELFRKIRMIDKQIDAKYEELERLKALALKVTPTLSEAGARASCNPRGLECSMDKIIALDEELNAEIDAFVDMKRTACEIIRRIENEKYRYLLESRYILGKTWETIAEEMGVAYQSAFRIHGRALPEAEKIYRKMREGDRR